MGNQKILVTGGCGYIGSHTIIEIIRKTDFEVISIDNCVNSSAETLCRIEQITGKEVKNYEVDLTDYQATKQVFEENPDIVGVIHFAALKAVGESVEKPFWYYKNNFDSLVNIMKACVESKVDYFIFSSSCSIYGNVETLPVNEDTPLSKAESPYAHTKKVGEEMMQHMVKGSNLKAIALRYFNPVGADKTGLNGENSVNPPSNLVPVITRCAVGLIPKVTVFGSDYDTRDGSCIRDYIHVTDIADAHIKALEYQLAGKQEGNYDVFNLGSGQGVTVLEAIKAFEKISGVSLNYELGPRRPGDVVSIYSDSRKAEKLLDWKPQIDLDEMITSAWKWEQTLEKERKK